MAGRRREALFDFAFIFGATLFSLIYFLGRWTGATPFVDLTGDAANIASFIAGSDLPGHFGRDAVLGNPANHAFYFAAVMPVVRWVARATGDYGTAFVSLLPILVFVQLAGFYWLGRSLMRRRLGAALFAIATSTLKPIWMPGGEGWGLFADALPRFTFQAALPYLLMAAIRWQARPAWWPLLMALAGLATYLHTPSGPAVGFSLWLGLGLFLPEAWSWSRKLGTMLGLGLVFLIVVAPLAALYADFVGRSLTGADLQAALTELRETKPHYTNLLRYYAGFVAAISLYPPILPAALMGVVVLVQLCPETRRNVGFFGLFSAGLVATGALAPLLEELLVGDSERLPKLILLVRGVRYLVPVALLFCIWPAFAVAERSSTRSTRWLAPAVAALFVGFLWSTHQPVWFREGLSCLTQTQSLSCPARASDHRLELLYALRDETPQGSTVLAAKDDLAIRYFSHRPVVFTFKNAGRFSGAGDIGAAEWRERRQRMQSAVGQVGPAERISSLLGLSRDMNADYLVLDSGLSPGLRAYLRHSKLRVSFANRRYTLIDTRP